eukprot:1151696-Pelagomonas_calceolata.AAC.1
MAYTDGSCHIQNGKQGVGAGFYCPLNESKNYVEPNGAGIFNITCQAELAAIAAAITGGMHSYSHIAPDSLISLHPILRQTTNLD